MSPRPRGFCRNSFPSKALASAAQAQNEKNVVGRFLDCVHPRPWRSSAASCFREVASGLVVQQKRSVAIEQHAHARSMIYLCTACALRRLCPALWESVPMRFASSMRFASWPSTADQRKALTPGRNLGGQKRASERRGCRWLTFATPSV